MSIMTLEESIKNTIFSSGPIGIDVFMSIALYDNKRGYYTSSGAIGKDKDFITAPEVSQMFGEMIANWVLSVWFALEQPKKFRLIELGPGRGTLMRDILRTLSKFRKDTCEIEPILVEINPILQKDQAELLKDYNISHKSSLPELTPSDLPTIIIANEFMDCFPIKQFVKTEDGWHEKLIGIFDGNLNYGLGPKTYVPLYAEEADKIGTIREICPSLEAFIISLQELLKPNKGQALLIDYGSFNGESGDSFQAIHKHKKSNPLENIGTSDLTAHVDFRHIVNIANIISLDFEGPSNQTEILTLLGIHDRAKKLKLANPDKAEQIDKDLDRLIGKDQMGELFKAIVLKSGTL